MNTFIINGSGFIPGVPGQFSNCIVTITDDGTITTVPLPTYPEFIPEKVQTSEQPAQTAGGGQ